MIRFRNVIMVTLGVLIYFAALIALFFLILTSAQPQSSNKKVNYSNPLGFSLKYPPYALLNPNADKETLYTRYLLYVTVKNLDQTEIFDNNSNLDEVKQDMASLSQNKLSNIPHINKNNFLVKVDSVTGREQLTIAQYEECDVQFTQKLVFYYKNNQVIISYVIPKNAIVQLIPEYLKNSTSLACPEKVWNSSQTSSKIINNLRNNPKLESQYIQNWKRDYDNIVKSIKLNET